MAPFNANLLLQAGMGRIWAQFGGPNTVFEFLTAYGSNQIQRPKAAPTPFYQLDPARSNNYIVAGKVPQPAGLITFQLESIFSTVASRLLSLDCPYELQIRYGICDRPDLPSGWNKILHIRQADPGNYTVSPAVAQQPTNNAPVLETLDGTGDELLELLKVQPLRIGVTETQNAVSVAISKNPNCGGVCGPAVGICQIVSYGTHSAGYGTANLNISTNGGATFAPMASDPFGADLEISAHIWIGNRVIAISDANTPTLAYSDDRGVTWTTVTYAGGAVGDLNDINRLTYLLGFAHVHMCGDGGFIYMSDDGGASFTAQSSGGATTQNLNKIRVIPSLFGMAVGDGDVILKTTDGATWSLLATNTGTGANLTGLWVIDESRAWVSTSTGHLFFTEDGGTTWEERTFAGNGTGAIHEIEFDGEEFGFLIRDNASPVGAVLRTIDGGATWNTNLTEGNGSIDSTPTNTGLNALAVCGPNGAFAVGNTTGGTAVVIKVGN